MSILSEVIDKYDDGQPAETQQQSRDDGLYCCTHHTIGAEVLAHSQTVRPSGPENPAEHT